MKKKILSILYCVTQTLFGVLILCDPLSFTSGIFIAIGIILTILGIIGIVKYFITPIEIASSGHALTKGLLTTLAGVVGIFGTRWLISALPVMLVYGFIMLIIGLSKIQVVTDTLRKKETKWQLDALSAALTLICALIVIFNPFNSINVLWIFTGIAIIVDAIFDLITLVLIKRNESDKKIVAKE